MEDIPNASAATAGPRSTQACERCRQRKVKCNGQRPCPACLCHRAECIFGSQERRGRKRQASASPKAKAASRPKLLPGPSVLTTSPATSSDCGSLDAVAYNAHREMRTGIGVRNVETGAFQFYGPSSHFCFLQRTYQRMQRTGHENVVAHWRNHAIPQGVQRWGLESFMFSCSQETRIRELSWDSHFSKELGDSLIKAYFQAAHPQLPVLLNSEIQDAWDQLCSLKSASGNPKRRALVYMVMAIGASMATPNGLQDASLRQRLAEHCSSLADISSAYFHDSCLTGTHVLLLKVSHYPETPTRRQLTGS